MEATTRRRSKWDAIARAVARHRKALGVVLLALMVAGP